ncbi:MAG: hypothetical protein SVR08_06360 [Spirochaetota bacterium]|nr:hypothetical protein [Spirochaetota bacterium]
MLVLKRYLILFLGLIFTVSFLFILGCPLDSDDDTGGEGVGTNAIGIWKTVRNYDSDDGETTVSPELKSIDCNDDDIDDVVMKIHIYVNIMETGKLRFYYKIFDLVKHNDNCGDYFDSYEGVWYCSDEDGDYSLDGNDLTIDFNEGTEYDTLEFSGKDKMRVTHPEGWTDFERTTSSEIENAQENCELLEDDEDD